jgi:hypothetical protein
MYSAEQRREEFRKGRKKERKGDKRRRLMKNVHGRKKEI